MEGVPFRGGTTLEVGNRTSKGGARVAIRFACHTSAIVYVPGPGKAEFRAGLLIDSGKEKD
jgi:hypothetical protein